MAIFVGQTLLIIELDTLVDLTTATTTDVFYKKPDGTTGTWTGTGSGTVVSYDVQAGDIDQAGVWTFQPFVTIGGESAYGESIQETVLPAPS